MHRQRPGVPHHLLLVYPTPFSGYKGSGESRQRLRGIRRCVGTRGCTGACAALLALGPALNLGLIPRASQLALAVQKLPANAGDVRDSGSIPGSERFPRGGQGNPFQYFCLENPMDRGASWAIVHGISKNQTPLSD